ncbi:MAG: serine protease [Bacteroidota bacterium]
MKLHEKNIVSREEAENMLDIVSGVFMENMNWDYISVVENKESEACFFDVGVYDFDIEKEYIKKNHPINEMIDIINVNEDNREITFEIPLVQNLMQYSLKYMAEKDSTKEKKISLKLSEVSCKPKTTINNNIVHNTRVVLARKGGYDIKNICRSGQGTLGGVVVDKNDNRYVVTNNHVIDNGPNTIENEDKIASPSRKVNGSEYNIIGTVFWRLEDDKHDIALVKVHEKHKVTGGVRCFNISSKKISTRKLKCGEQIKICGIISPPEKNSSTIKSTKCTKRRLRGENRIFKCLIQTHESMSEEGDSGSFVFDDSNHVVGLLIKDFNGSDHSYFMSLDILTKEIQTGDLNFFPIIGLYFFSKNI